MATARRSHVFVLAFALLGTAATAENAADAPPAVTTSADAATSSEPVTPADVPIRIAAATAWAAARVSSSDGAIADILYVTSDENELLDSVTVFYSHHMVRIPGATISTIAPHTLQTSLSSKQLKALPH
jgi:hypothetical protein